MLIDFRLDVDPHLSIDAIHDRVEIGKMHLSIVTSSVRSGIHDGISRRVHDGVLLAQRRVSIIRVKRIRSALRGQDLWEFLDARRFSRLCDQNGFGDPTQFFMLPVRILSHSDKAVDRDHFLSLRHD